MAQIALIDFAEGSLAECSAKKKKKSSTIEYIKKRLGRRRRTEGSQGNFIFNTKWKVCLNGPDESKVLPRDLLQTLHVARRSKFVVGIVFRNHGRGGPSQSAQLQIGRSHGFPAHRCQLLTLVSIVCTVNN